MHLRAALIPVLFLTACGGNFVGGGLTPVDTSVCASGQQWTGGGEGSSSMSPGQTCVSCHATGEGPDFLLAGTVYGAANEANNCAGVSTPVQVQITDANGQVLTLTTNAVGNFYLDTRSHTLAMPYTAKLIYAGGERPMMSAQSNGDCNSCHTAAGANGAPGRIAVP